MLIRFFSKNNNNIRNINNKCMSFLLFNYLFRSEKIIKFCDSVNFPANYSVTRNKSRRHKPSVHVKMNVILIKWHFWISGLVRATLFIPEAYYLAPFYEWHFPVTNFLIGFPNIYWLFLRSASMRLFYRVFTIYGLGWIEGE